MNMFYRVIASLDVYTTKEEREIVYIKIQSMSQISSVYLVGESHVLFYSYGIIFKICIIHIVRNSRECTIVTHRRSRSRFIRIYRPKRIHVRNESVDVLWTPYFWNEHDFCSSYLVVRSTETLIHQCNQKRRIRILPVELNLIIVLSDIIRKLTLTLKTVLIC